MHTNLARMVTTPLALALAVSTALTSFGPAPAARAQSYNTAQDQRDFSQQELDQMLAPIALYPDPLLSQILMASTYPLEVVEAARWSRAHSGLRGDAAVRAVENMTWDPSVKSLVAFPQILAMMDQKLDWTERMGDAFLDQEPQVMDTVQRLRQRAYAEGNLRSNDQVRVVTQGPAIVVEPAQPQVVYVPYYDPTIVYGSWWWPAYPPVYWAPWPGYRPQPGIRIGMTWGSGIALSAGFFFGAFDWPQRHARVVNVNNYYYNRTVIVNRETHATRVIRDTHAAPGNWRHDPEHRRGVPYRSVAVRQEFARGAAAAAPQPGRTSDRSEHRARTEDRSRLEQARQPIAPHANAREQQSPARNDTVVHSAAPEQPRQDHRAEQRGAVQERPVEARVAPTAPAARMEAPRAQRADAHDRQPRMEARERASAPAATRAPAAPDASRHETATPAARGDARGHDNRSEVRTPAPAHVNAPAVAVAPAPARPAVDQSSREHGRGMAGATPPAAAPHVAQNTPAATPAARNPEPRQQAGRERPGREGRHEGDPKK